MDSAIFHFRPQTVPTLALLCLLPAFLSLGLWQLDRAQEKRLQATTQETRRALPPLQLNTHTLARESAAYRKLSVKGYYLEEKQIYIEHRKYRGKTGFHIITPLRLAGSERYLLVNRGWLAAGPDLRKPTVETPQGMLKVTGEAYLPAAPAIQLNKGRMIPATENRWPYMTLPEYRDWSALPIHPFILLQSPEDPHGFVRQWADNRPGDRMHTGYAIQWFAFALITLIIWLKLSLTTERTP